MTSFRPQLFLFSAGVLLALLGASAQAGLGRPLSEAARDGQPVAQVQRYAAQAASGAAAGAASVQTQTVQTPQGVAITEYANAAGTVFAITWKGPFKPDLQQLLGSYFAPYVQAAKTQTQQLNLSMVKGSDIVVHSAGRMRGFLGVAWVPTLVPAGFDPSRLQP
ncbi:MAG: hypothetical protein B7Z83_02110 [Thiomonas sp. 20-64-5]|nr:MAG: hypothetical protein B7Z83_02110 [Thiomonas sp. 20-64-5]